MPHLGRVTCEKRRKAQIHPVAAATSKTRKGGAITGCNYCTNSARPIRHNRSLTRVEIMRRWRDGDKPPRPHPHGRIPSSHKHSTHSGATEVTGHIMVTTYYRDDNVMTIKNNSYAIMIHFSFGFHSDRTPCTKLRLDTIYDECTSSTEYITMRSYSFKVLYCEIS